MKLIIMTLLAIALRINDHSKIVVIERQRAMNITAGYTVSDGDSVFYFNKKKYVMLSREFFEEDGNIKKALLRRDLGYLELSRQDIISDKNSDFSRSIEAMIIDNNQVKVNSEVFLIARIDKKHKKLYYTLKRQPQYLNCLVYR